MIELFSQPARAVLTGPDAVNSEAFSPDGARLASVGAGDTVRVWDAATGKQVGRSMTGHIGAVLSVAFSPDGARLASVGAGDTVRVWDAATGKQVGAPLTGHTGAVSSVAFSPNGARLASAGYDRTVRLWNVALPRNILRAVCDIAGRGFTAQEWSRYIPDTPYRPTCRTSR